MIPKRRFLADELLPCLRPIFLDSYCIRPFIDPFCRRTSGFTHTRIQANADGRLSSGRSQPRHVGCKDEHSRAIVQHDLAIEKQDVSRQDQRR